MNCVSKWRVGWNILCLEEIYGNKKEDIGEQLRVKTGVFKWRPGVEHGSNLVRQPVGWVETFVQSLLCKISSCETSECGCVYGSKSVFRTKKDPSYTVYNNDGQTGSKGSEGPVFFSGVHGRYLVLTKLSQAGEFLGKIYTKGLTKEGTFKL